MSKKTNTKPSTITLYDWEASSLLFRKKGETDPKYTYLYGEGETSEVIGPVKLYGYAEASHGDKWFLFFVADCMSPPGYLVKADHFGDAHEQFIEDFDFMVKIENHFEDYTDDPRVKALNEKKREAGDFTGVTMQEIADIDAVIELRCCYNDSGTPCDTEAVQGWEVELIEARSYPFGKNPHEQLVYLHDALNSLFHAIKPIEADVAGIPALSTEAVNRVYDAMKSAHWLLAKGVPKPEGAR